MGITEQYAIDTWRLHREGQPPPPHPGSHEAKVLRAWWTARREARRTFGTGRRHRRRTDGDREDRTDRAREDRTAAAPTPRAGATRRSPRALGRGAGRA